MAEFANGGIGCGAATSTASTRSSARSSGTRSTATRRWLQSATMRRCASSTERPVGKSVLRAEHIGIRGKFGRRVEIMELPTAIGEINLDGADRVLPFVHALPFSRGLRRRSGQLAAIHGEQRLATLAIVRDRCPLAFERSPEARSKVGGW